MSVLILAKPFLDAGAATLRAFLLLLLATVAIVVRVARLAAIVGHVAVVLAFAASLVGTSVMTTSRSVVLLLRVLALE